MSRRADVSSTKRAAEVNPGVVQCGTSSECSPGVCGSPEAREQLGSDVPGVFSSSCWEGGGLSAELVSA